MFLSRSQHHLSLHIAGHGKEIRGINWIAKSWNDRNSQNKESCCRIWKIMNKYLYYNLVLFFHFIWQRKLCQSCCSVTIHNFLTIVTRFVNVDNGTIELFNNGLSLFFVFYCLLLHPIGMKQQETSHSFFLRWMTFIEIFITKFLFTKEDDLEL